MLLLAFLSSGMYKHSCRDRYCLRIPGLMLILLDCGVSLSTHEMTSKCHVDSNRVRVCCICPFEFFKNWLRTTERLVYFSQEFPSCDNWPYVKAQVLKLHENRLRCKNPFT